MLLSQYSEGIFSFHKRTVTLKLAYNWQLITLFSKALLIVREVLILTEILGHEYLNNRNRLMSFWGLCATPRSRGVICSSTNFFCFNIQRGLSCPIKGLWLWNLHTVSSLSIFFNALLIVRKILILPEMPWVLNQYNLVN